MTALDATLYAKAGCHLCESAEASLARLQARYPHRLHVRDITRDAALFERYALRIPVLAVGGVEYDAPLTPAVLTHALQRAGASR
jgi:Glutaredoxin-like domain (DUF836)